MRPSVTSTGSATAPVAAEPVMATRAGSGVRRLLAVSRDQRTHPVGHLGARA